MARLLEVSDLRVQFDSPEGVVNAVDGVSFHVDEGEIVGVAGESGCGKSVSQLAVLRLVRSPPGRIVNGEVLFDGRDLMKLDPNGSDLRSVRGGKVGMVFQEPMTSLNPVLSIGRQLTETLELHLGMNSRDARTRAAELLESVGIAGGRHRMSDFPHMFSGGMRQRVMIAMAISCNPRLVIADEATTALDVTTQAQILALLKQAIEKSNTSLIIVTHDLGLIARYAHRLYIMYAGKIVESGTVKEVFGSPRHPYTQGLLRSVPRIDQPPLAELVPIRGVPPNLLEQAVHCPFLPRCPSCVPQCERDPAPQLVHYEGHHYSACYADLGSA